MRIWSAALEAVGLLAVAGLLASLAAAAPPVARPKLSAHDAEAKALLAKMTLEEKVGQMTQAEQDKLSDEGDIQKYLLGSLLSGGSIPLLNWAAALEVAAANVLLYLEFFEEYVLALLGRKPGE